MAQKNLYDVIVDNNRKINSDLADVTGEPLYSVGTAAAENAMKESEFLAATGGTRHDLYNIEAKKELSAQVGQAQKEAQTLYDLSKPTYGKTAKSLYDVGMQNSGYAKYATNVNAESLKQNLYSIDESKKAAQQTIDANTAALKAQNQQAYAQYLSQYGTVLDDYNRYKDKDEYTEAQIIKKLQEDGYTADQINAIQMLQAERTHAEGEANRDALISDLNDGKISREFAQIQLLSTYGTEDADKIAEDVKNGIISPEAAQGWADSRIAGADEAGARYSDDTITQWQNSGIISQEQANAYKAESAKIRSELASKAFDSMENVDNFLAQFEEGYADVKDPTEGMSDMQKVFYNHPIAGKAKRDAYAQEVEQLKVVKAESALTHITQMLTDGSIDAKTLETAAQGYTDMLKGMNDTEATEMLGYARQLYDDARKDFNEKSDGMTAEQITSEYGKVMALGKAVEQMYISDNIESVKQNMQVSAQDGLRAFGNWASGTLYGNEEVIGTSDYKYMQNKAIQEFIEQNDIKVYTVQLGGQSRDPKAYGVAYYISYNGKVQKAGQNMQVGDSDFTVEQINAIKGVLGNTGRFHELHPQKESDAKILAKIMAGQ